MPQSVRAGTNSFFARTLDLESFAAALFAHEPGDRAWYDPLYLYHLLRLAHPGPECAYFCWREEYVEMLVLFPTVKAELYKMTFLEMATLLKMLKGHAGDRVAWQKEGF
jgi:hypothetical protein